MKKFLGYLWYLSEEVVAVAFYFYDKVSLATKLKMVDALNSDGVDHPRKHINVDPDLVDKKSRRFCI
jgi:hypothetical protein